MRPPPALIGITLAATVAVAVIEGGRRREERARKEAETNFVMAQGAVKDYLTSVSENTLLKQQDSVDIRSLRKELLNTALRYYKNFVDQRNDDPNLRQQLANAYFRVGEITQEIDSQVEAIEAFRSAQKIWRALAAADPGNHEITRPRGRLPPGDRQAARRGRRPPGGDGLVPAGTGDSRAARGAASPTWPITRRVWRIVTRKSGSSRAGFTPAI